LTSACSDVNDSTSLGSANSIDRSSTAGTSFDGNFNVFSKISHPEITRRVAVVPWPDLSKSQICGQEAVTRSHKPEYLKIEWNIIFSDISDVLKTVSCVRKA
jgi:hypothetical protein